MKSSQIEPRTLSPIKRRRRRMTLNNCRQHKVLWEYCSLRESMIRPIGNETYHKTTELLNDGLESERDGSKLNWINLIESFWVSPCFWPMWSFSVSWAPEIVYLNESNWFLLFSSSPSVNTSQDSALIIYTLRVSSWIRLLWIINMFSYRRIPLPPSSSSSTPPVRPYYQTSSQATSLCGTICRAVSASQRLSLPYLLFMWAGNQLSFTVDYTGRELHFLVALQSRHSGRFPRGRHSS